jgi:hypothetical protein
MAKDVDDITVGANGTAWVAPVGTAVPADEVTVPGVGWVDLGYIDEKGVTLTDSKTMADIAVWQLFYPARKLITARAFKLAFVLRQWMSATVTLAFGGGTITTPSAGHNKFVPPAPEVIDERAMMLDWVDGGKNYRLVIPRGLVTDNVASNIVRTAAADLPIGFEVLGSDGVAPWYLLNNDPAIV